MMRGPVGNSFKLWKITFYDCIRTCLENIDLKMDESLSGHLKIAGVTAIIVMIKVVKNNNAYDDRPLIVKATVSVLSLD